MRAVILPRMTATAATERMWTERVRSWRESGETAEAFAEGSVLDVKPAGRHPPVRVRGSLSPS